MKRMRVIERLGLSGLSGLLALAGLGFGFGCASAPPERFFSLSSGVRDIAALNEPAAPRVVVEPAALPELVDRPQLVLQADGHQVTILEQQRWAEPLRTGIPRVVAENLTRLLGTNQVSTRDDAIGTPDCRVVIDVRRFESQRGSAVSLDTLWVVSCAGAPRRTGQAQVREPVTGDSFDAVVAAHGRALDVVSRDIATAVRAATGSSNAAAL